MKSSLDQLLENHQVKRISHIGSTAVKTIYAKPIVDILVEIDTCEDMEEIALLIEQKGFIRMSSGNNRVSFNYGYTENGFAEKVYHVHLRYAGDNDELFFRDYLNEYPEIAKSYEQMKLKLWKQFEYNRDAYTEGKTTFIRFHTEKAKIKYKGRY